MVLAPCEEEGVLPEHPYWYARVVNIFHVECNYAHPERDEPAVGRSSKAKLQHMDILYVRWFGLDTSQPSGWNAKRLPSVGFIDGAGPDAFSFLDPGQVVRAAYVVPAFMYGQTDEILGPSIVRQPREHDLDWMVYHVNV
ncbi:hypothetical protein OF83DRAFT_1020800, partial [Amylostereum chailletii]